MILRADGDALVMHVGERPYLVAGGQPIAISTHGLNLESMTAMLSHLLSTEARLRLDEFGAVEHPLPGQDADRFIVVAAKGDDDIWMEIRRRRRASEPGEAPPASAAAPAAAAVVIPLTRTVRIEVPARNATASRTAPDVDRLLRIALARGASALFLASESRPSIRVDGDVRALDSEALLSRADVDGVILEIAPEDVRESLGQGEPTEWIAEFADLGLVRCTTFADHRGPGVLLRIIPTRAATAEQLGLAPEVQALASEPQGLVLVASARGCGKSTMISALVDLVNRHRAEYVITLEQQVRLIHENRAAIVSQREVASIDDAVTAARFALRENPDVLVVDDLVSPRMVPLLLSAASEGVLVLISITAASTTEAVQRFLEMVPADARQAAQAALAESFRGAVAQVLLKKAGGGQVAAREILLAAGPVTRVIREGQIAQLPLALENGRKFGMVSFTDALADFVRSGSVDLREAFRKTPDRDQLLETLKHDGIDTSVVERLA